MAIIMDGNGRWALRRGLSPSAGHRAGLQALRAIVEAAPELAISTLTLFAFSSDNWKRPPSEVAALMTLLRGYLRREATHFIESGARLVVIGRLDRLPARLPEMIRRFERATRNGKRLKVRIALDYSARDSIVRAISSATGKHPIERDDFVRLVTASATGEDVGSPEDAEVDLLIRTGGEKRLSDFMLWESAYAELIFTDVMWPEFRPEHLRLAVEEFRRRTRRFGGIGEPATQHHHHGGTDEELRDAN